MNSRLLSQGARALLAFTLCSILFPPGFVQAAAPLRVLIFSGQNNHDWKTTTPRLKSILTESGRFAVDVTERPDQCTSETLAPYDLILSDWNAWGNARVKDWPAATREAFLNFIRGGKGHVSVHAGGSSFYDWPEYQQVGGLSWNLAATSHGAPHEFSVQFVGDHPVTRGLASFRTKDELWLKPGVHPAAQVLATGDGQTLAVATALGQGRGFALLLGHSAAFMDTPGFQTLLLRGAEWAATGKVTLSGVGDARALDVDEVIKGVAAFRFGEHRKAVFALEKLVFAASTDASEKEKLAAKLARALETPATTEGKQAFCQGLSLIGGAAEVPFLARALLNTNLFFHARQGLERNPSEEATAALRSMLTLTRGAARVGIIESLAARRSEPAIPDFAILSADSDPLVAGAAIEGLGKIANQAAANALLEAGSRIKAEHRDRFATALLKCAESLQASGRATEAASLFEKLVSSNWPAQVRLAAFASHVACLGEKGTDAMVSALTGNDATLQKAALRAVRNLRQPGLLRAAVERLNKLPADMQEAILALCGERGEPALLPAVTQAIASADEGVRRAAIKALGLIGNSPSVKPLVSLIEPAADDERKLLSESLGRLRGAGVDAALVEVLPVSNPVAQRAIVRALIVRDARGATPALLQVAGGPDASVRREAVAALGKLADAGAGTGLIALLERSPESDKAAIEAALVEISRRDLAAVASIASALPKATLGSQAVLLGVLGSAGGSPACAAVRSQIHSAQPEVRLAAIRVLAEWPDAEPIDDLAGVVETTTDARIRALAARGLNRMAPQAPARATRAAEALARALASATDPADRKSFLSALVGIPSVPSLKGAQSLLKSTELAADAAGGVLKIAEVIYPWHRAEVKLALADLKSSNPSPELARRADALAAKLDQPANLAVGGLATSPDGLEKDGQAGGDQAAIDGDPKTYWDEENGQKLYLLRVQLRARSTVACLRIQAWAQHDYAAKDFEVLCDGKVVKTVAGATYEKSFLIVEFPPVQCDSVELKITGYYGQSPAIRELEIYEKPLLK